MDPIDLSRLRDFSDGTEAGLRQLAEMFLVHMDECATGLRGAVAALRAEAIRADAHRAAGTAGACGAELLAGLMARLETCPAERLPAEAPGLMQEIDVEMARVHAFFATVFNPGGDQPPAAGGLPR